MTAVEVISVHRRYEVTVTVHVTDAEPRDLPYSTVGRRYVPTRVRIDYWWTSDDTDQRASVVLSGPRLLKHDARGAVVSERRLYRDVWPEWVRALVEEHRPRGDAFAGRTP